MLTTDRPNRRRTVAPGRTLIAAALALLLAAACSGDDDPTTVAAEPPPTAEADAPPADEPPADAPATEAAAGCPPEDGSGPQVLEFSEPPPMCIDESTTYEARMVTSAGDIVIRLDPALDPVSVNNFVFLARNNFYDGSTFHRVIEGFVIQGGDPVGDPPGTGGPGYDFTGGFGPEEGYELGAFAMANRSDPSSNGAQFFIITGADGQALPPLYSPMGVVTEGLEVATSIQEVPTDERDRPLDDVVVEDVVITEAA